MIEDFGLQLASVIIKVTFAAITITTAILAVYVKKWKGNSQELLEITKMTAAQSEVIFKVTLVVAPLYALGLVWLLPVIDFFKTEIVLALLMFIQIPVEMYLVNLLNRKISETAS